MSNLPAEAPTNEDKIAASLAKTGIGTGGKISAFVPTTLDETWRLANIIAKSGMAPRAYKNAEQVMVGIMAGLEIGLTPFTALQSIAVIGNNPTVWGDGALALVEASGLLEWHTEEFDDAKKVATCTVKRLGKPSPTVRTFSFEEARAANLMTKDGPWKQYPKRMCQMRARAFALRDTFADVMKGLGIAEEVRDHTPVGETRTYGEGRPSLTAALLQGQASGDNAKIDTIEGEATEVAEEPQAESSIPAWLGEETRLIDALHLAVDRPGLEAVEKDFLKIKATFPEDAAAKMQKAIDEKFNEIALGDD